MKLKLTDVRLSFPQLWEKKQVNGQGEAAYSAAFIIAPNDPQIGVITKTVEQVAHEKWGDKASGFLKALWAQDKVCLHNGDLKAERDGYEGNWYVNARTTIKPLIVDQARVQLTRDSGIPYGGCYVDVVLEVWAQDNPQWGKRVNATLKGVQFRRDGDAFAGGAPADPNDFDDLADQGEEKAPRSAQYSPQSQPQSTTYEDQYGNIRSTRTGEKISHLSSGPGEDIA